MTQVASWNVNSLKVRLPQLLEWLAANPVDVIGLQETKLEDANFPAAALQAAGYHVAYSGQKTYNGVALLSRQPLTDVSLLLDAEDPQRRFVAATCGGVRYINVYVPNGQALDSDKYVYKLRWLQQLQQRLQAELAAHPQLVIMGDFNIAPDDRDVHDPAAWQGQILCSEPEPCRACWRWVCTTATDCSSKRPPVSVGGTIAKAASAAITDCALTLFCSVRHCARAAVPRTSIASRGCTSDRLITHRCWPSGPTLGFDIQPLAPCKLCRTSSARSGRAFYTGQC